MDLIFEAPWWLYVAPAVVGAALAVTGARRGDKTLRNVGVGLLLVGVAVYAAGRTVETSQETVTRRSRELVTAVERKDWAALSGYLDPQARLTLMNAGILYDTRDEILTAAKTRVDQAGVSSLNVPRIEPRQEGQLITTEVEVTVFADQSGGRPVPTTWQFVWTRTAGNEWVVRDLEAIAIHTLRGEAARGQFPGKR